MRDALNIFGDNISLASLADASTKIIQTASTSALDLTGGLFKDYLGSSVANKGDLLGRVMLNVYITSTAMYAASSAAVITPRLFEKASTSSMASGTQIAEGAPTSIAVGASSATAVGTKLWRIPLPETSKRYIAVGIYTTKKIGAGKVSAWLSRDGDVR